MTMTTSSRRPGMLAGIAAWWRNLRAGQARLDELHNCGAEVGHIARDVGLATADLYTIAARRPDAADQLKRRLAALELDRAALLAAEPMVVRDLERVCTVCGSKHRCERDLARQPDDAVWRTYCPNAQTLEALEQDAPPRAAK